MNGAQLLQALREKLANPELPVIFVTGEIDTSILAQIEGINNARLLAKPFSPRRVITLIEECLA